MKLVAILGGAAILGGGLWMRNPYTAPNVYALAPADVYEKLMHANVSPTGSGPFNAENTEADGDPGKSVTWSTYGMDMCTALIAPEGGGKSRLDVTCPVRGEGAAAGIQTAYRRRNVIELIDATLRGRAYDREQAPVTAHGWPKDTVHHGGIGEAAGKALEMEAQMRRDMAELEKARR